MQHTNKIGIIICDRYRTCGGGKCFKSIKNREGAFSRYKDQEVEVVGYTTCNGCPGVNVEYVVDEMKANGAETIHLATGLIVGYPPCPNINYFHDYITTKYGLEVIYGTHPIPEKYLTMHEKLNSWQEEKWKEILPATIANQKTRLAYN